MRRTRLIFLCSALILPAGSASAQFTFSDSFTDAPSPLWSNLRGSWFGHDGLYDAASPTNAPPTNSSLPFPLQDFTLDVDINDVSDGGIWLRSDPGAHNGVLLVTGGGGWGSGNRGNDAGNALYFHAVTNDNYSGKLAEVARVFTPGDEIHLKITVVGNTYSVYLNDAPAPITTLTTSAYPQGRAGLYDYSAIQTFDNFSLTYSDLPGDANLNGRIDPDDFALTDRGSAKHLAGWSNGDFNNDNVVDAADYALLYHSFSIQNGNAPELILPIPEPSIPLSLAGLPAILSCRRAKHPDPRRQTLHRVV